MQMINYKKTVFCKGQLTALYLGFNNEKTNEVFKTRNKLAPMV